MMEEDLAAIGFRRLNRPLSRPVGLSLIDEAPFDISYALQKTAEYLGVTSAALLSVSGNGGEWPALATWNTRQSLRNDEASGQFRCPWIIGEITRGYPVLGVNPTGFPPEATVDRATCRQHRIHSLYALPLSNGPSLVGALLVGIDERGRTLDEVTISHAQIAGEMLIAIALRTELLGRLISAVESSGTGLWSLDVETMTYWATATACKLHGLDTEAPATFDDTMATVDASDRARVQRTVKQNARSARDIHVEYRVPLADGFERWILSRGRTFKSRSGKSQQVFGACNDITRLRNNEADLRNSRALSDAVFDSAPGALYLYTLEGRLIRWNEQLERMTGYATEELSTFQVSDWFLEDDLPALQRAWDRTLVEGQATVELGVRMKDGTIVPFSLTGRRVEINGTPHVVGIGTDITERRRIQGSVAELRAELHRAGRINTLGELASTMAHDLSQPLAAILSNAQAVRRLLAVENPDLAEVRAAIDDIIRDDKHAGEMVHGLRDLMTKGKSVTERLDPNTLVHSITDLVHGQLVSLNIPIKLDLDPDLPPVEAAQTEILQILLNLLLNGIDAQRQTDPNRRRLQVRTSRDAGHVIVSVTDCGAGIPEAAVPYIFKPFFSTKTNGLGMGLAICRRIAESYHGRIWAENNPNGGATFHLSLPIATNGDQPL